MGMKKEKNKMTAEERYNSHRDMLRHKDNQTVRVNGKEVVLSDFYKDPKKYTAEPIDPEYQKECEVHHDKMMKDKERLQFDPSTVKSVV